MIPMNSVVADQSGGTQNRVDNVGANPPNDTPNRVNVVSILLLITCFIVIFVVPVVSMQNSPISGNNDILLGTQKPIQNHNHSPMLTWLLILIIMAAAYAFTSHFLQPTTSSKITGRGKVSKTTKLEEIEMSPHPLTDTLDIR